jgi:hypothetical protein
MVITRFSPSSTVPDLIPPLSLVPKNTFSFLRCPWFRRKPMHLCVYKSEDHEHEVGPGVNTTLLSACEGEDHEHGVGTGANTKLLSDTL